MQPAGGDQFRNGLLRFTPGWALSESLSGLNWDYCPRAGV